MEPAVHPGDSDWRMIVDEQGRVVSVNSEGYFICVNPSPIVVPLLAPSLPATPRSAMSTDYATNASPSLVSPSWDSVELSVVRVELARLQQMTHQQSERLHDLETRLGIVEQKNHVPPVIHLQEDLPLTDELHSRAPVSQVTEEKVQVPVIVQQKPEERQGVEQEVHIALHQNAQEIMSVPEGVIRVQKFVVKWQERPVLLPPEVVPCQKNMKKVLRVF
jgi:hypothetical protein